MFWHLMHTMNTNTWPHTFTCHRCLIGFQILWAVWLNDFVKSHPRGPMPCRLYLQTQSNVPEQAHQGLRNPDFDPPDAAVCRDHRGNISAAVNDLLYRICGALSNRFHQNHRIRTSTRSRWWVLTEHDCCTWGRSYLDNCKLRDMWWKQWWDTDRTWACTMMVDEQIQSYNQSYVLIKTKPL